MGFETLCMILLILVAVYYWSIRNWNYWEKRKIPYVKPLPVFGNLLPFLIGRVNFHTFIHQFCNRLPEAKIIGFFEVHEPVLLIRDPSLINEVLNRNFDHFYNRDIRWLFRPGNKSLNPLSDNLFSSFDERWHYLSKTMSLFFTSRKLRTTLFEQVTRCANTLDQIMANTSVLDVEELFIKFTTDTIGSCAFGIDLNTMLEENSMLEKSAKTSFQSNLGLRFIMMSLPEKILDWIGYADFTKQVTNFFVTLIQDTVRYREEHNIKNNDLMDMMIELKKNAGSDVESKFDDTDIIANTFLMFSAGYETTGTALKYCVYELALHPEIQTKLREEICNVTKSKDGSVSIDALNELEYLSMVISETLRKYPPDPITARICTKPYTIPGTNITLEPGAKVWIPTMALHHDQQYYPDPDKFDPLRFSSENKAKIVKGTYFPFGDGPRYCLGKRFALMILKVALSKIVAKYKISPCERTEIPLRFNTGSPFLKTKNGTYLSVHRINE